MSRDAKRARRRRDNWAGPAAKRRLDIRRKQAQAQKVAVCTTGKPLADEDRQFLDAALAHIMERRA